MFGLDWQETEYRWEYVHRLHLAQHAMLYMLCNSLLLVVAPGRGSRSTAIVLMLCFMSRGIPPFTNVGCLSRCWSLSEWSAKLHDQTYHIKQRDHKGRRCQYGYQPVVIQEVVHRALLGI
jgi:hypothetical protein